MCNICSEKLSINLYLTRFHFIFSLRKFGTNDCNDYNDLNTIKAMITMKRKEKKNTIMYIYEYYVSILTNIVILKNYRDLYLDLNILREAYTKYTNMN